MEYYEKTGIVLQGLGKPHEVQQSKILFVYVKKRKMQLKLL